MKIEERFVVAAPIETVWTFIRNPEKIGPCVPGCLGIETIDDRNYRAKVAVAFGPIKPTFGLEMQLTDERPPNFALVVSKGEEGGNASRFSATSTLALTPVESNATEVHYASEVSVVGRLATYGLGLMKKKAKTLGEEFASNIRKALESGKATA